MTGDLGVTLVGSVGARGGDASQLVLAETKSETERAETDRELVRVGRKPVSLSEYRFVMDLVGSSSRQVLSRAANCSTERVPAAPADLRPQLLWVIARMR
jgi:hypothetical protein